MPIQDLTPQLRTRLSRVERAVGWFISIAVIALFAALGYYIYHRAELKGWFLTKINYQTSLNNANGLKVGDPVKLMGFNVGEITGIEGNEPGEYYGVTISFRIKKPYYGYIWLDSKARVQASDFLGNRYLEVTKGTVRWNDTNPPPPTVIISNHVAVSELYFPTVNKTFWQLKKNLKTQASQSTSKYAKYSPNALATEATNQLAELIAKNPQQFYTNINATNYWLEPLESPALTERLDTVMNTVEAALPSFLNLTNQLTRLITNTDNAVNQLNATIAEAHPLVTNLNAITSNLRDTNGSLGTWILGNDLRNHLTSTTTNAEATLIAAQSTLTNADTNLTILATDLDKTLINLANMTSNLNAQVQQNNHIISYLDVTIAHLDQFVQGIKHHWLLRSAFKNENKPAEKPQKK